MTRHYRQDNPLREARSETIEARRALVREALAAFGEPSARRLAKSLNIPFETCRETIAQFTHPQSQED